MAHDIWQNNATEIAEEVAFVTNLLRYTLPPSLRDRVFFVQGERVQPQMCLTRAYGGGFFPHTPSKRQS